MDEKTIKIGGMEYKVLPLTFVELEEVEDAFSANIPRQDAEGNLVQVTGRERVRNYIRIIHAGISRANPGITIEDLKKIPGVTREQMLDAAMVVAKVSGLVPDTGKAASQGEGQAASQ